VGLEDFSTTEEAAVIGRVSRLGTVAVAVVLIAGCTSAAPTATSTPSGTGPSASVAEASAPVGPKERLVFGGFGGAYEKAWTTKVIPAFEQKYNAEVSYVIGGMDPELIARLKAGGSTPPYDVVALGQDYIVDLADQGLLEKLDPAKVPNLANLYPLFRDPFEGYAVGTDVTPEGIGWNTKNITTPFASWGDLWRPDLKGKIALPDISHSLMIDFLVMTALMNGGATNDGGIVKVTDIDKAFAKLKELRPSVKQFYTSSFDANTAIQTGQVDAVLTYSGDIQVLKDGDFPAEWVAPKEGSWPSLATIGIPKGTTHLDLAQKFVDFALSPEAQSAYNGDLLYAPVTTNAELAADVAPKVIHGPDLFKSFLFLDYREINKVRATWDERWKREFAPNP
jgi:putative spermidine/putrescine transport system substrate-binding protein